MSWNELLHCIHLQEKGNICIFLSKHPTSAHIFGTWSLLSRPYCSDSAYVQDPTWNWSKVLWSKQSSYGPLTNFISFDRSFVLIHLRPRVNMEPTNCKILLVGDAWGVSRLLPESPGFASGNDFWGISLYEGKPEAGGGAFAIWSLYSCLLRCRSSS